MGRPTKLDDELIQKFADEIVEGLPVCYTCDFLEVDEGSYQNWMAWGKRDLDEKIESVYSKFFLTIKKSYAQFVKNAKAEMKSRMNGWQSIAWWLERTNPFFMPKQQILPDADGKVQVVIGGKVKDVKPVTKAECDKKHDDNDKR